MPRRRSLTNFPKEFAVLTDRAIAAIGTATPAGDVLLTLDLKVQGSAINIQMQLRQYWAALAAINPAELETWDENTKRVQWAGQLAVRYRKGSKTVIEVVHRSQLYAAKALAEALGTGAVPIADAAPAKPVSALQTPMPTAQELETAIAKKPMGQAQEALLDAMYQPKAEK